MATSAILALEDGTIFKGVSIGADGSSTAEVVFNTSMTGYQEILTDPSYARQMVTLTYPHIGNTGVNSEDEESKQVWCEGLIIRDLPLLASSWRKEEDLDAYLKRKGVVGIADIDTRKLTRILREKGAQAGCIMAGEHLDEETAIAAARAFPGLKGMDLAKEVTSEESYQWTESNWDLVKGHTTPASFDFHVVAYDFGVKTNILRMLVERGCRLTVCQRKRQQVMCLRLIQMGFSYPMVRATLSHVIMRSKPSKTFWRLKFLCLASALVTSCWPLRAVRKPRK